MPPAKLGPDLLKTGCAVHKEQRNGQIQCYIRWPNPGYQNSWNHWANCLKIWHKWLCCQYYPACQNSKWSPLCGHPGKWVKYYCCLVFTVRRYASVVYAVIVCLSLSLSVTSRSSTKMAEARITQTMPYDSQGTLIFWRQQSWRNFSMKDYP